jgi:hypothetical protein
VTYFIDVFCFGEWAQWCMCSYPWRTLTLAQRKQEAAQSLKYWRDRSNWQIRLRVV